MNEWHSCASVRRTQYKWKATSTSSKKAWISDENGAEAKDWERYVAEARSFLYDKRFRLNEFYALLVSLMQNECYIYRAENRKSKIVGREKCSTRALPLIKNNRNLKKVERKPDSRSLSVSPKSSPLDRIAGGGLSRLQGTLKFLPDY